MQHSPRDKRGIFGCSVCRRGRASLSASGDPIKIGFSLALTGPSAPNGKQALLGAKIWEEEINATGGSLAARSSS